MCVSYLAQFLISSYPYTHVSLPLHLIIIFTICDYLSSISSSSLPAQSLSPSAQILSVLKSDCVSFPPISAPSYNHHQQPVIIIIISQPPERTSSVFQQELCDQRSVPFPSAIPSAPRSLSSKSLFFFSPKSLSVCLQLLKQQPSPQTSTVVSVRCSDSAWFRCTLAVIVVAAAVSPTLTNFWTSSLQPGFHFYQHTGQKSTGRTDLAVICHRRACPSHHHREVPLPLLAVHSQPHRIGSHFCLLQARQTEESLLLPLRTDSSEEKRTR